MDLLQREGKYPVPPQAPKTLGVEFSGTVEELSEVTEGEKGHAWKKRDEVLGLAYGGELLLSPLQYFKPLLYARKITCFCACKFLIIVVVSEAEGVPQQIGYPKRGVMHKVSIG